MLLLSLLPLGLLLFNSEHSLQKVEQLLTSQTTQALDHQGAPGFAEAFGNGRPPDR